MVEEATEEYLLQEKCPDTLVPPPQLQSSRKAVLKQYLAALIVNLLMLDVGQSWSWISSAQVALMSPDSPVGSPFTFQEFARIQICLSTGYLVGCCFWAKIADLIGRKRSVLLCGLIKFSSWIALATATSKLAIFLPAFIQGLSGSGTFIIVPFYISEATGKNIRSTATTLSSPTYVFGVLFSYSIGSILSFRYFLFTSSSVSIVCIVLFSLFPESPSYLWAKGDQAGAGKSLLWLEAGNSALVKEQLRALSQTPFNNKTVSFLGLIRNKKNRRGLGIVLALTFFSSACGADFMVPLASGIFIKAGFDETESLPVIALGASKFLFSLVAPLSVANFRRKPLLKSALTMISICSFIIGLYLTFYTKGYDIRDYRPVVALCACLIQVAHVSGLSICVYPMAIELLDRELLSRALSVQVVWSTLCAINNFESMIWIVSFFGFSSAFFIFSTVSLVGLIFIFMVVPETKGVSSTDF